MGACTHGPVEHPSVARDDVLEPITPIDLESDRDASARAAEANEWASEQTDGQTQQVNEHFDNIWMRIRAGMTLDRELAQSSVRHRLDWYSRHQAYLDRVAERATPYLYYIVEQLEARDMPLELALLPIVESAYQPLAYSRSHASGIWQFIPATGKRYGLKQNWWYDGRRDIIASTRAALDYLQFLHAEFDGDWQHAVAAYNAGENNVRRAIARNRAAGRSIAFWHLQLPRETRGYVPALLAIAEIVANPQRHGVTLKPIANKPYFTRVATGGQIDLSKAAALAGLEVAVIKQLNPGFKRWATDPDGPHSLLVPLARADKLATAISRLPADQRLTWRQHRIRRGETLSQIARHYGTTVAVLQRTNHIRGHLIRTGQHLLIPAAGAEHVPAKTLMAHDDNNAPASANTRMHIVTRGDSLWTIARRYGTDVGNLTAVNNISSNSVLKPGQKLRLPRHNNGGSKESHQLVHYTVRRGDSLWTISRRFQVSVGSLREWNGLSHPTLLQPGQELQLYVDAGEPHGI